MTQSANIVTRYPPQANMKAKGYSIVVKSPKVSFESLKKCIMAVARNTPPANCVPRTRNDSFHLRKYGETPPKKVAKKTMIKHQIFTKIRPLERKPG